MKVIARTATSASVGFYRLTTLGLNKGAHVTRYFMYRHLSRYTEARSADLKVLSISRSQGLGTLLGFDEAQITDASYPDYSVLDLPFEDGSFDAVVSDQVLEHVEGDPSVAMRELFRVLKPGGTALHTTCFINPIHGYPQDYWRFTPKALELLTAPHAEVVDVGGWGNRGVWFFVALGLRYQPIPHARWHPAHWVATVNNAEWPIVTWVLAKKAP